MRLVPAADTDGVLLRHIASCASAGILLIYIASCASAVAVAGHATRAATWMIWAVADSGLGKTPAVVVTAVKAATLLNQRPWRRSLLVDASLGVTIAEAHRLADAAERTGSKRSAKRTRSSIGNEKDRHKKM